jgi:hypothetical protein
VGALGRSRCRVAVRDHDRSGDTRRAAGGSVVACEPEGLRRRRLRAVSAEGDSPLRVSSDAVTPHERGGCLRVGGGAGNDLGERVRRVADHGRRSAADGCTRRLDLGDRQRCRVARTGVRDRRRCAAVGQGVVT